MATWTARCGICILLAVPIAGCGRFAAPGPDGAAAVAPLAVDQAGFAPIAWVQLGDDGGWIARAVLAQTADCPAIVVDGQPFPMLVRHTFAAQRFPVLVCEFRLRTGERASIGDLGLPVPTLSADAILLLGDTGCRLTSYEWQGCLNRDEWPFQRLLSAAAALDFDLTLHVGDYHYREQPCAGRSASCAGSPWGDTWDAWRADFFEPAREALLRTPWIMLRGNHETCARAGAGWHQFLSPTLSDRAPQERCSDFTAPYRLALADGPDLVILDTADDGGRLPAGERAGYLRWAERAGQLIREPAPALWVLLHQPLRTLPYKDGPAPPCQPDGAACQRDEVERALAERHAGGQSGIPKDVVITGHVHMFQYVAGGGGFVQLVSGMSGTYLDAPSEFEGFAAGARQTTWSDGEGVHYTALARYGFTLLTRVGREGWVAEVRAIGADQRITAMLTCALDDIRDLGPSGCTIAGEAPQ